MAKAIRRRPLRKLSAERVKQLQEAKKLRVESLKKDAARASHRKEKPKTEVAEDVS